MSRLPMFYKGLTPELVKKAEVELNDTTEVRTKALIELSKIVEEQHGCVFEDEFLVRFLRVKKFDVKKSAKVLRNFLNLMRKHSGVFTHVKPSELRNIIEMNAIGYTSYRMPNYAHVAYLQLGNYDPSLAPAEELVACVLTWNDITFEYEVTEIAGGIMICDFLGANFQQYRMFLTLSFAKFIASACQDSTPLRIKGIHFVNEPAVFRPFFNAAKYLFGKTKLSERIHIHGSNLSSLHEYIPKDILPPVFGGTAEPMDNEELASLFYSYEDLIDRCKARVLKSH